MSKKYFIKNILFLLCPLMIPLTLLGALSYSITENYVKQSITINNSNMLRQIEQQVDMIFNEMYSLNLDYSGNPEIILTFKELLRSKNLNYDQSSSLNFSTNYLRTQAIARPFIHSIYIYYDNANNRVLTSNRGMVKLDNFFDQNWYVNFNKDVNNHNIWVQNRTIKEYSFEEEPEEIISLYKNIYWSYSQLPQGLIVLNIHKTHFENILNSLDTYENQSILVIDEENNLLFGNKNSSSVKDLNIDHIRNSDDFLKFELNDKSYLATSIQSKKNGWTYASIVETNILYKIPIMLKKFTLLFMSISLLLGIGIIFYLTRRNVKHVNNIISIIKSAKRGQVHMFENISFKENEFRYIIENIVKTYVDQNQLKMELNEKKYKLQSAEWHALQSQMNPHFLSNTLTTIYWRTFALTGKPNKATEMLEYLSDILNFSLRTEGKTVSLKDEIHHTSNYIEILKIRFENKIEVIWKYEIANLDQHVLKFLLQPFVENSVQHGLNQEQQGNPLKIKIKIERKNNSMQICIIDNGQGMDKSQLASLYEKLHEENQPANHIGITNTYNRLRLTYNDDFTLKILSKPIWGTSITIQYPICINTNEYKKADSK